MIQTNNAYISDIKARWSKVRSAIIFLIAISACISIVYFFYWIAVVSEPYILTISQNTFSPLASFLSPFDKSVEMYRHASFVLFCAIAPLYFMHYLCDKAEEKAIDEYNKKLEAEEKQAQIRARYKNLKKYDDIKSYSICLSLDYKAKRELSQSTKETLNKIIYSKFKDKLNSVITNLSISATDVLIITSEDFSNYDFVYETTLKILAKIKSYADDKYNLETIPSITTDAYIGLGKVENIKKDHFQIQSFNFKNRACSTGIFAKKYKHINKNKYAGVPIGEYAAFDKDKTDTYELNIVYKNLSQTLASLQ